MTKVTVAVKRLDHGADLPLPSYATTFSAGADLFAALKSTFLYDSVEFSLLVFFLARS